MTDDDRKKQRPDPFAPLPLDETLLRKKDTGRTAVPEPSRPVPAAPVEPAGEPVAAEPVARVDASEPTGPIAVIPEATDPAFAPSGEPDASWASEAAPSVRETTDAARPLPPDAFASVGYEPMPAPAPAPAEPVVADRFAEAELRAAVGVTPLPEPGKKRKRRAPTEDDGDDDAADKPRNRKLMLVGALAIVVGAGITATVLLGRVNSARYVIACEATRVVVAQGRAFPPWGESALDGAEWKPLAIPPEAPCAARETESKAELAAWYGTMLEDQATAQLTAREVDKVDEAEANLKQALLVARSLASEDARIDTRERIERLLGDVAYWRASAKLRSAADALAEAAKQFDAAAMQKPRYVTDAAAWAAYVRKLVDDLHVGPAGEKAAAFPPLPPAPERPAAPLGTALPVEPDAAGSASEPAPPPPPIDAGPPSGGVLL